MKYHLSALKSKYVEHTLFDQSDLGHKRQETDGGVTILVFGGKLDLSRLFLKLN